MKVAIIGTGYVGLTTGVALAFLGHEVVGIDKDARKLALLRAGKSPIHEHGLEEMLAAARSRLRFTDATVSEVAEAEVVIIAVGTPPRADGAVDCTFVESAAREVAQGLRDGRRYTVVVKSTVPIGTNRRVRHVMTRVLRERGVEPQVSYVSNPEFLREGKALTDMLYPDRIVVGVEPGDPAVETMRALYEPILSQTFTAPSYLPRPAEGGMPVLVTADPASAEMIKYAANAFLALKVSYINEIAGLCDRVGASVTDVARGIGLDSRIGPRFLGAGIGWGGSCFPKDTIALLRLAQECGYTMPIVAASREVNQRQRQAVVEKLQGALKVLRGRTICVLGIAFKPDTDDVRDSPAVDVIRTLLELGAHVRAHDPVALTNARTELGALEVDLVDDPYLAADGADAIVLATEWAQYRDLDFARLAAAMRQPLLFDGRNLFNPEQVRTHGFEYLAVGR